MIVEKKVVKHQEDLHSSNIQLPDISFCIHEAFSAGASESMAAMISP